MMGERTVMQEALFYGFSLERHVPADHLLRSVDRFVDLSGLREQLRPFYSETGRPSIDPELLFRMLLIGYCFGIRSERRLCEEVHLNLAYRWFCRPRCCRRRRTSRAVPVLRAGVQRARSPGGVAPTSSTSSLRAAPRPETLVRPEDLPPRPENVVPLRRRLAGSAKAI